MRFVLLITIFLLCFRSRLSFLEPYENWSYKQHLSFINDKMLPKSLKESYDTDSYNFGKTYYSIFATNKIKRAGLEATNTIIEAIEQISGKKQSQSLTG